MLVLYMCEYPLMPYKLLNYLWFSLFYLVKEVYVYNHVPLL